MSHFPVSVTIITQNEEACIRQAIESVRWADDIIVVDSGSKDQTVQIAKEMGARTFFNPWHGYGQQKNFAQKQAKHDWVLNIDADETVSEDLKNEILTRLEQVHTEDPAVRGFSVPRKTFYLGRWVQYGGWYPNYLVRLANRNYADWTEPHVHEDLAVRGRVEKLLRPLNHDAFRTIEDQIHTNLRFARLGSEDLKRKGQRPSILKLIFKPIGKFFETYVLKMGFRDGLRGFIISVNAAHSMFLKHAFLHEVTLKNENLGHR